MKTVDQEDREAREVWHQGHIGGGYHNPRCGRCLQEDRHRLRELARRGLLTSPSESTEVEKS